MPLTFSRRLFAIVVAAVLSLAHAGPGAAQDAPPPGATDGIPVGAEPDAGASPDGEVAGTGSGGEAAASIAATSSPPERYFSREAYEDIRQAAQDAARPCRVSDKGLQALILSPIFFESSGALTESSAPSPMTLSRYDEWNPSFHPTTTNLGANQSLYEGRNPNTPYARAYWHPGIGIWQYDSAGLGAPYSAVQRMDARVIAPDVAKGIMARYCGSKASGGSDLQARRAAWSPWVGCADNGCEQVFWQLYDNDFAQMRLLDSIARLGGTQMRVCSLPGHDAIPCAYVDHRKAQGARWWAVNSTPVPINDGDPTKPPAPLSYPFYVFTLDGLEHRHWLRADTGYAVDISATRRLGRNARYRTDQPGSGLAWSRSSALCDLTTGQGACGLTAPSPLSTALVSVSGTYRPVSLDANGDSRGDVLWYAPGAASDHIWLGTSDGFDSHQVSITGDYEYVLAADLTGDGSDDLLFYDPDTGASYLWRSLGGGSFSSTKLSVGTGRQPFTLDVDGSGPAEIMWYGPGSIPDSLWRWNGSRFIASPRSVSGEYTPLVGDFDNNKRDDIFWYAPGPSTDHLWLHSVTGATVSRAVPVKGRYEPLVGDFDGDGADDIFWYAAGPAADSVWFGGPGAAFAGKNVAVNGSFVPVVADLTGSGRDDIVWHAPGRAADHWWIWSANRSYGSRTITTPVRHHPIVGAFSASGGDGVLWYAPGSTPDVVWHR